MNSAGVESECSDAWVRKRGFWKWVGWVGWCVHVVTFWYARLFGADERWACVDGSVHVMVRNS